MRVTNNVNSTGCIGYSLAKEFIARGAKCIGIIVGEQAIANEKDGIDVDFVHKYLDGEAKKKQSVSRAVHFKR